MFYATFRLEDESVFTEEQHPELERNYKFCCEHCGRVFAEAHVSKGEKWCFITSHCYQCDPKWGGSFFDYPYRALWNALPKRILEIELEQERNRGK